MASAKPEAFTTNNQVVTKSGRKSDPHALSKASTIDNSQAGASITKRASQPKNLTVRSKLAKSKSLSCKSPSSNDSSQSHQIKPRAAQIIPRTTQYEKHPLLQERTASGLSALEEFLLERAQTKAQTKNFKCEERRASSFEPSRPKLKLEPRGALYERNALLEKTGSGLTQLERILQDKERELERKEKKRRSKEMRKDFFLGSEIAKGKRLWVTKRGSVEKARSFERTACLEKNKTIDIHSRARSLEEESSLEKFRDSERNPLVAVESILPKVPMMEPQDNVQTGAKVSMVQDGGKSSSNPKLSNSEKNNLDTNLAEISNNNVMASSEASSLEKHGASAACSGEQLTNSTLIGSEPKPALTSNKTKKKLLDLALRPNLEWKEEEQCFVMFVQSPVSPPEEKPENLLIRIQHQNESNCDEALSEDTSQGGCQPTASASRPAGFIQADQEGPAASSTHSQEPVKPKKYVHPSVIESDSDSEGMVCMDELESIDFNMSSPEPSPAKVTSYKTPEEEPLITGLKETRLDVEKPNVTEPPKETRNVTVLRREISDKRGSLGRLEPRMEQYERHALLEDRDELGRSIIERFLEEKEKEILHTTESNSFEGGEDAQKHQPKASIKRVHFEKSETPEIEELGTVEIEADPGSTNSTKESSGKRISFRGLRGSKNSSKSKGDSTPEEKQSLTEDSDMKDKGKAKKSKDSDRCCCVS